MRHHRFEVEFENKKKTDILRIMIIRMVCTMNSKWFPKYESSFFASIDRMSSDLSPHSRLLCSVLLVLWKPSCRLISTCPSASLPYVASLTCLSPSRHCQRCSTPQDNDVIFDKTLHGRKTQKLRSITPCGSAKLGHGPAPTFNETGTVQMLNFVSDWKNLEYRRMALATLPQALASERSHCGRGVNLCVFGQHCFSAKSDDMERQFVCGLASTHIEPDLADECRSTQLSAAGESSAWIQASAQSTGHH